MVMAMWARIENDTVVEITGIDPAGRFHPSLVWVACDGAAPGDRYVDGSFEPAPGEDMAALERAWRDSAINPTEWLVGRHRDEQDMELTTTLQASQFAELLQYRQALRDWPQSGAFPAVEHRPAPPAWLADLTS
ncbi:hypothetical protein G3435_11490 [Pseudomonas sp. MAFF212428]|uniref:Phage tail assembly chaperone-like domain-containing protein n=2 Tax=Pseudomonas brassicae TaxID=2708063 RepID=A0A6B3NVG8_9PSED|nr:hypothetical protein [Pseudomonas brassicae]NER63567.1 hypothetical protein [Pseudomonas brassicae]